MRHHDELTLDRLSESEREEIFKVFAPDEAMRIYNRGIRRRLPPMLNGDRPRIELTYSLLFTLPGTPVVHYGDEIGMGNDLSLEERNSVRTPMQWSSAPSGGFSTASPDKLPHPVISQGEFSYPHINVANQQLDPTSLLNWMERTIRVRKQCPEFGWGKWQILETDEPCVFAHSCEWEGKTVVAIHNLTGKPCTATLKSAQYDHLTDLFCDRPYEPLGSTPQSIPLGGYGYRWFRVNYNR